VKFKCGIHITTCRVLRFQQQNVVPKYGHNTREMKIQGRQDTHWVASIPSLTWNIKPQVSSRFKFEQICRQIKIPVLPDAWGLVHFQARLENCRGKQHENITFYNKWRGGCMLMQKQVLAVTHLRILSGTLGSLLCPVTSPIFPGLLTTMLLSLVMEQPNWTYFPISHFDRDKDLWMVVNSWMTKAYDIQGLVWFGKAHLLLYCTLEQRSIVPM
jgi:hypothetical protein